MSAPSSPRTTQLQLPVAHRRATLWAAALWTLTTALAYLWHAAALAPQLLRMGASSGERLVAEPWRVLAGIGLTDGALHLAVAVFGLLVAQPLEAVWGTSGWLVVLLGASAVGQVAAAAVPTQLSVGPVAGLAALLVATLRLRQDELRSDARTLRNLRRAAGWLLALQVPLLVLWPAVSPLALATGVALGWVAPHVTRLPERLRQWLATGLVLGLSGALAIAWQTGAPWRLDEPPETVSVVEAGWRLEVPGVLRRQPGAALSADEQGRLLIGDPQLDSVVGSVVPAPAEVTATHGAQSEAGRMSVQTKAVVADCRGKLWQVRASALVAAPEPWRQAAAALVASVRAACK